MCTFKLLKALCSVLVTTRIESPVKIKGISVTLGFLKCLEIELLTWECLIGIMKSMMCSCRREQEHTRHLRG